MHNTQARCDGLGGPRDDNVSGLQSASSWSKSPSILREPPQDDDDSDDSDDNNDSNDNNDSDDSDDSDDNNDNNDSDDNNNDNDNRGCNRKGVPGHLDGRVEPVRVGGRDEPRRLEDLRRLAGLEHLARLLGANPRWSGPLLKGVAWSVHICSMDCDVLTLPSDCILDSCSPWARMMARSCGTTSKGIRLRQDGSGNHEERQRLLKRPTVMLR